MFAIIAYSFPVMLYTIVFFNFLLAVALSEGLGVHEWYLYQSYICEDDKQIWFPTMVSMDRSKRPKSRGYIFLMLGIFSSKTLCVT